MTRRKYKVIQWSWTQYGRDPWTGEMLDRKSGYCLDQGTKQALICTVYLWKIPVFRYTMQTIDVPSFAVIADACTGYTDWRSPLLERLKQLEEPTSPSSDA